MATSFGISRMAGTSTHSPSMRLFSVAAHVFAELVEGLFDGVEDLVVELGQTVSLSGRVARHEGLRLLGLERLALLGPLALLGLDGDERVGAYAVLAT